MVRVAVTWSLAHCVTVTTLYSGVRDGLEYYKPREPERGSVDLFMVDYTSVNS